MTPIIESFYQPIAQAAFDCVPIDFLELWVSCEALDDVIGADIFIRSVDGSFRYTSKSIEALQKLLYEMREAFRSEGKPLWSTLTFWLNAQGKFSVDFGYEDVSDFEKELKRREAWINKYLGRDAKVNYAPLVG